MKRWPIIVGLLSYLIFCVAAWEIYREPVGEKLEQRAAETLAEIIKADPSAAGGEIGYEGMRGTLRGIGDAEIAERVRDEIALSVGWGTLEIEKTGAGETPDQPAVVVEVPEPPTEIAGSPSFAMRPGTNAGTWIMEGQLADDDLIDALVLGTRAENDAIRWIDAEHLRSGAVEDPGWTERLPEFVGVLVSGADNATLQVNGGKMVIGGTAKGAGERETLLARGKELAGDSLEIEDAIVIRQDSVLIVVKVGDQIAVEGILPNGELAGKLVAAIESKFFLAPAVERGDLKVDAGGGEPDWFVRAVRVIPDLLAEVDPGRIEVSDGGVSVFAGVRSEGARENVLARTGEIAGGEIPVGEAEVTVLKPPKLAAVLSGEKVSLSGRLPSAEHRAFVESSILGFLSTVKVENGIVVDENVWDPAWLPPAGDAIPEFLQIASGLGDAKIEIDGDTLTASAKLTSDELKKPAELLFSPLGRAGLKVDLMLEVLSQPRLILSHSGGKVKVGGRLKDAETRAKFLNAAAAAFPDAEVEDSVVLDGEVAESGWDTMVLDMVSEVMSKVEEPGIDLRPGKVRIEGEVRSEPALVALEERLHKEFGAAFEIENAIRITADMVAESKFEIANQGGKWALFGMVSTKEEKAEIFKAVELVRPRGELIDHLEVAGDIAASPWIGEIAPVIAAVANADKLWVQVFQGTLTVECEFPDAESKNRLGDAGAGMKGLKFEDWSTLKKADPGVVVPPPPELDIEPGKKGS